MKQPKAVKVQESKPEIWLEKRFGDILVMVQHERCEPFCYAEFHYHPLYTDNALILQEARALALRMGSPTPVVVKLQKDFWPSWNAPFTTDQLNALRLQQTGLLLTHPYTCRNRDEPGHKDRGFAEVVSEQWIKEQLSPAQAQVMHVMNLSDKGLLIPREDGLLCPDCGRVQQYATAMESDVILKARLTAQKMMEVAEAAKHGQ